MRASLFGWRSLVLAAARAVWAGAGVWLGVAGARTSGPSPNPAGPVSSPASANGTPKLDLQALPSNVRAPRTASCGGPSLLGANGTWLPDWLDDPSQPSLIAEQASRLRLLDFFWLGLGTTPDSILQQPDNPGGSTLGTLLDEAAAANPCGWRFVTISEERRATSVLAEVRGAAAASRR